MDYPIQPISVIEEQGRAAARAGLCQKAANPYATGSGHSRAWLRGYAHQAYDQVDLLLRRANAAQEARP